MRHAEFLRTVLRAAVGDILPSTALVVLLAVVLTAQQKEISPNFHIEKVADGIFAVIRREPASLWFNPNTVFIVGSRDVTVVDSNISSEYTREVLSALRTLTNKPVRHVVNTHWHEDHIIGNRVYREAFPKAQFIGHRSALTDLPETGAANRKNSLSNGPGFIDLLKRSISDRRNLAGQSITDEERRGYESDIRLVGSYLAESPDFEIVLPTVLVDQRLELNDGRRTIEILHLGRAHTAADLVVYLPKDKIVVTGDLIVHPVPLVGSTSYPLEYAATLEKLVALGAEVFVPGHGPVMRDPAYLRQLIGLLTSIKRQAEAAVEKGETLEQLRKSVDLEEYRRAFAGESQHKSLIFRNYVFMPATAAAHRQLMEKRTAK